MKLLICDPVAPEAVDKLKKSNKFEAVDVKAGMKPDELLRVVPDYEVLIVRSATKVTADVIRAGKKLKLVARGGIGLDNIDVKAAKEAGIKVINTPGASTVSVAELAMAHMLAASRALQSADKSIKDGKWEKKKFEGHELYRKAVGIIGFGRIGQATAKRCLGFEMSVLYYDIVRPSPDVDKELHAKYLPLDELLPKVDFVTLHLPLTPETKNLLDTKQFSLMKQGVAIVNCSRGGVVNEDALFEAMKSGKVAYAASDVFEKEPPGEHKLLTLPNFYATPHIGAQTIEGQYRVGLELADKIVEAF
jgi:D-3-phosphoglycerate dehydrogenase